MEKKESTMNKIMSDAKENKIKYGIIAFLTIAVIVCIFIIISQTYGKKIEYIITFNTNGGSYIEPIIVKENDTIPEPDEPTKEGFAFAGWYYNDELYDFDTPVTSNMELEAKWGGDGKVSGITLNQTSLELYVGDSYTLVATIKPSDAKDKNITWESNASDIVSVDGNGNVKALKEGTAIITATTKDGGHKAQVTIIVKKKAEQQENKKIKVTGITLNKTKLTLTEGEKSKLVATVKPSNATNKNVTWKSSAPDIVSVDSKGNIKALKPGTAIITVTTKDGGYKATCTVTVIEKKASYSIVFTPVTQEVTGAVVQYSMTATKNSAAFSNFNFVIYNNTKITNGHYLALNKYNKNITTATIRLVDGTDVTANVIYK